jgi:hypothetical protein
MTEIKSLKQILLDGKIKPSSKTKIRNQNPFDFFSPYNFFNTIPKTKVTSFTKPYGIGIIFKQNILHDRVFYTNEWHSAGNTKSSKRYKISNNKDLTKILYSLYLHSIRIVRKIKMPTWVLSGFQEVFTKKEPMLCEAVYVIISSKETKTIKKIKTMYPNIQIINSIH